LKNSGSDFREHRRPAQFAHPGAEMSAPLIPSPDRPVGNYCREIVAAFKKGIPIYFFHGIV